MRRIARVGADIDPGLTDRDVERLVEGARLRRRRRAVARVGAGRGGGRASRRSRRVVVMHGRRPRRRAGGRRRRVGRAAPAVAAPAPAAARRRVAWRRRSIEASALAVREDAPRRVAIELARGRGHFEVAPRPERPFSVHAGDVTITVHRDGVHGRARRRSDRRQRRRAGSVLVDWGVGSRRLGAGESGWFPPLVVDVAAPAARPRRRPRVARPRARPRRARASRRRATAVARPSPHPRRAGRRPRARRDRGVAARGGGRGAVAGEGAGRRGAAAQDRAATTARIRGRRWRRSRSGACC